ncbi:MAG: F0F1 ATP synthase subunit epsilon [Deltaproteobacteria bacterium]|jgi:F-type H+-transporting ATPase subunit epsilon|nr:F0F1 ATP synthase subunit epsilon [Deltaproteobacteria bacterium]
MEKNLQLDIVTPDNLILSRQVEYVGARAVGGDFGVLPGHVPFLSALAVGPLHYTADGRRKAAFVGGGFVEVSGDKVIILAERAELAENIDHARALEAKNRAEKRLLHPEAGMDADRAQMALIRAISRLRVCNIIS